MSRNATQQLQIIMFTTLKVVSINPGYSCMDVQTDQPTSQWLNCIERFDQPWWGSGSAQAYVKSSRFAQDFTFYQLGKKSGIN